MFVLTKLFSGKRVVRNRVVRKIVRKIVRKANTIHLQYCADIRLNQRMSNTVTVYMYGGRNDERKALMNE